MESKDIQKYSKKTVPELIKIATKHFNNYIRERDRYLGCISCDSIVEQAGHFYSGGHYPELKFNENNVHGQCVRCNYYLSGNLNEYRKQLEVKIGKAEVEKLDLIAEFHRKKGFKWDRFSLIEIILKYK